MRDMRYKVAFYCPDQHISYNLYTLNEQGVGGGITARIRMAHALAECGHDISLFVNCPATEKIEKVRYYYCAQLNKIATEILVVTTSGDGLDLSNLHDIEIDARLRILMIHGIDPPTGVELSEFDYIYALSNYVRRFIVERWGIARNRVFVSHRGVKSDFYGSVSGQFPSRDPFGIIYAGHPSKGLDSAIAVLRQLRKRDSRFSLHIYGGYRLWGEEERTISREPGVFHHGLVGQRELAYQMQKYGFSLNLQARTEPFGMVLIESMKAGCIVIASPVGAFTEIIQHGQNGFLLNGDHIDATTRLAAAELILKMLSQSDYCKSIRQTAIAYPLDWQTIAKTWTEHWDWDLGNRQTASFDHVTQVCTSCGASLLFLSDGYHCTGCGEFQRYLSGC